MFSTKHKFYTECVNTLLDGNILATFFDNNKKTVNKAKLVFFIIQMLKVIAKNVYETVRVSTVYKCRDTLPCYHVNHSPTTIEKKNRG